MSRKRTKPPISAYLARRYMCEVSCMLDVMKYDHPDLPPALISRLSEAMYLLAEVFEAAPGKEDL